MKTLLFSTSVVLLAGATGLAWQATRDEQDAARSRERITAEATRTREAATRAELRLAQAGQAAGELRTRLAALQRASAPVPVSGGDAAAVPAISTIANLPTPEAVAAKLAEAREKTRQAKSEMADFAKQRVWIVNTYQPLFTALGLSPEQCETFVDIGMKRHERLTDLGALKREKIVSGTDPVVAKYEETIHAEEDAAYREFFGPVGHQRFIEYNRTASARLILSAHAAAAVWAGIPFTAAQLEQFVQVAVANYTRPHVDRQVFYSWQYDHVDWDKADVQLRPLMSAAQWELFLTHAPGGTGEQSRVASKFNQRVENAKAADKAALAAQTAKPPGS